MLKNKIKKISVIVALSILLAGGLGFGVFKMVTPLPVFGDTPAAQAVTTQSTTQADTNAKENATEASNESISSKAADTDNVQDVNKQDNAQEANGAAEANETDNKANETANEPAGEKAQEANLPGGGHQDQDNVNVDHQFEGIE